MSDSNDVVVDVLNVDAIDTTVESIDATGNVDTKGPEISFLVIDVSKDVKAKENIVKNFTSIDDIIVTNFEVLSTINH